jgi:hypothetical protein
MSLTPTQLATLKSAMLADANLTAFVAAGNDGAIAAYYNATGAGNLWRPIITVSELNTAIVWSEFAGLTVALQNTYLAMVVVGSVDATNVNIRNGFSTVFTGKTSLTNLSALAQRVATRLEALYAVANVCPIFGYVISVAEINQARTT